jgi:hypothetical protein
MGSPGTANKVHNPAAVVSNTIPNGGWTAWAQVLGAFFIWLNTWYSAFPEPMTARLTSQQGPCQRLRSLAILLRNHPAHQRSTLHNRMDRVHPSLSTLRRRRPYWPYLRRRPLPTAARSRHCPDDAGSRHGELGRPFLAATACAGLLRRDRTRVSVHAERGHREHVLFDQGHGGDWARGCWERYW